MDTLDKRGRIEVDSLTSASFNTLISMSDDNPIGSPPTKDPSLVSQAINTAIQSASSDVYLPAGRYTVKDMLFITINTGIKTIRGEYNPQDPTDRKTNTIIDTTFYADKDLQNSVFHLYGSSMLVEEFSSPISKGSTTYTFNGPTNFSSGDLLVISDPEEYSYGYRYYYKKGEVVEIKDYDSKTHTVTFTPTVDNYSSNCYIYKLSPVRDITIKNLVIAAVNPDPNKWLANSALRLRFCSNITVNDVVINEAAFYNGLIVDQSYHCNISSIKSKITATKINNVYAVNVTNSQKITLTNLESASWWEAFGSGGGSLVRFTKIDGKCVLNPEFEKDVKQTGSFAIVNREIIVKKSKFTSLRIPEGSFYGAPANFHGNTESSGFYGCTLIGGGFNIGGHNNTLYGNTITPIYRDPTHLNLSDIGIYFNENLSMSFTIEGNYYIVNGFRQDNLSEENTYGEFLHSGIVDWWIADDLKKNPCRTQIPETRRAFSGTYNFVFKSNHYIVVVQGDPANMPNVKSKMLRLCSVQPDDTVKRDMDRNLAGVPEIIVDISGNEAITQGPNGESVIPHSSGIDICTNFLNITEWLVHKSVTIRDNRLDRVRLSINKSALFYPGRLNPTTGVVIVENKVITYADEGRNTSNDPLITCQKHDPLQFDNPDFSNIGGDPSLKIEDFAKFDP